MTDTREPTDEITIVLTRAEAERLYASAAMYETKVHRIEGIGEAATELGQAALTKLATAIFPVDDVVAQIAYDPYLEQRADTQNSIARALTPAGVLWPKCDSDRDIPDGWVPVQAQDDDPDFRYDGDAARALAVAWGTESKFIGRTAFENPRLYGDWIVRLP